MEVVNILPTPVAIIPCPFHSKVKETVLEEIKEQEVNQLSYNINSRELKHVGHYSVLHNDERYGRFRNWCEQQAELYACLLYTSPSPRDRQKSRMPSSA